VKNVDILDLRDFVAIDNFTATYFTRFIIANPSFPDFIQVLTISGFDDMKMYKAKKFLQLHFGNPELDYETFVMIMNWTRNPHDEV